MNRQTLVGVAISVAIFHEIGCGTTWTTYQIDDPTRMSQVILKAVPIGSDIAEAERFMKDQGFTCQRERNAKFGECKGLDYLSCYRKEGSIVYRTWQVAIVYQDGKISEVLAKTVLTGP